MAPLKQVSSLQDLALQAVQQFVITVSRNAINNKQTSLHSSAQTISELLRDNTPPPLHDRVAQDFLKTLEKLRTDYVTCTPISLSKCEELVTHLVANLHFLKIEKISICVTDWSEFIYSLLTSLLDKMPFLKILKCSTNIEARKNCPLAKKIADSCPSLSNLTSFTLADNATNSLIAELCKNCGAIREILVPESLRVTNSCISHLTELKLLQVVELFGTSVAPDGYYDLLTKSQSNNLFNLGRISWFSGWNIACLLEKNLQHFRTFPLQRFHLWMSPQNEEFRLIVKYFPYLKDYTVDGTAPLYDSSDIAKLKNLTHLSFTVIQNGPLMNHLNRYFLARGPFITSLSVLYCVYVQSRNILEIFESCPNIEYFKLESAHFCEALDVPSTLFPSKPFEKLTELIICKSNISLSCLESVLSNACNIQKVTLLENATVITDDFIENVLRSNPLKKLQSLEICSDSNFISARMLKHIITHCDQISSLKGFDSSWVVTKTELEQVKAFIVANNYDLILE